MTPSFGEKERGQILIYLREVLEHIFAKTGKKTGHSLSNTQPGWEKDQEAPHLQGKLSEEETVLFEARLREIHLGIDRRNTEANLQRTVLRFHAGPLPAAIIRIIEEFLRKRSPIPMTFSSSSRTTKNTREQNATFRTMILDILTAHPDGLKRKQILAEARRRLGTGFPEGRLDMSLNAMKKQNKVYQGASRLYFASGSRRRSTIEPLPSPDVAQVTVTLRQPEPEPEPAAAHPAASPNGAAPQRQPGDPFAPELELVAVTYDNGLTDLLETPLHIRFVGKVFSIRVRDRRGEETELEVVGNTLTLVIETP